jgi:hypothetical protein
MHESAVAADGDVPTLNRKADGYRGIWYMNQPSGDEYVYKYSGGMGTYCAKHAPFAIYRPEVDKTFFCYGGATIKNHRRLLHMVSYYDHKTNSVPRPTILLDKKTNDAHDNPVISIDDDGYVWIFSTSHGRGRPSYIHRSVKPYDIDEFKMVSPVQMTSEGETPIDNFSYFQAWHRPKQGFVCFFTRYKNPAARTSMFMSSADGVHWSEWKRLAAIDEGHYQVSGVGAGRIGASFNFHPKGIGLNGRTNLYYMESTDGGETWQSAAGDQLELPLVDVKNAALVHDYQSDKQNVYLKDVRYDENDRPVLLYITSKGYESGPKNDPRTWTTAQWTGKKWDIRPAFTSDNNYDMGSLWLESDGTWKIIGPTQIGPQPYNPGGEVALWTSSDRGATWEMKKQLTSRSERNQTYVRRAINANDEFYAIWADGHGRKPSESHLYFCDREGTVRMLPRTMSGDFAVPELVEPQAAR